MEELSFEEALKRLEELVAKLEAGDLSLEQALEAFEEGVRLSRLCSQRLNEAQKRVSILLRNQEGGLEERPFDLGDVLGNKEDPL
ncbi:MAG: exodeoxyribonuclease VII small subunit [candidate division NC10 bacterium]|nr:exodeoxyribonuclease VII small subunit [candidate division NC10 bacterium]